MFYLSQKYLPVKIFDLDFGLNKSLNSE